MPSLPRGRNKTAPTQNMQSSWRHEYVFALLLVLSPHPHYSTDALIPDLKGAQLFSRHKVLAHEKTVLSEAEKLEQQVRAIREEIAALEGKTVDDVEKEAMRAAQVQAERETIAEKEALEAQTKPADGRHLMLPETGDGQVAMAARAVERAFRDGVRRQTVRFALVPLDGDVSDTETNAGWPGGAQQMYMVAGKPLTMELLRRVRAFTSDGKGGVGSDIFVQKPKVKEQMFASPYDLDGSALFTAEAPEPIGSRGDVQALLMPNTDAKYISDIETIDAAMKDRAFLLVNPMWRDLRSWGINILQPNAKKRAQEIIFERCGFGTKAANSFSLLRFSVRGERCAALRCYPYDWQIFAYLEDDQFPEVQRPVRLGTTTEEPTTEEVEKLLAAQPAFKFTKNIRRLNRR